MRSVFLLTLLLFVAFWAGAEGTGNVSATGRASSPVQETALRLAKADALEQAFLSIKKDELFQNLYISDPAVYGQTQFTGEKNEKDLLGKWTAVITVTLRPDVLSLILNKYTETVSAVLNQAESELSSIESLLKQASKAMDAAQFGIAFKKYTEVVDKATIVERSLEKFSDLTVRSDKLNNKEVLINTLRLRRDLATNGLKRLDEIERQATAETAQSDLITAFDQYQKQQRAIARFSQEQMDNSPFYDADRDVLEKTLVETRSSYQRLQDIRRGIERLQGQSKASSVLFQERMSQSLSDNQELQNSLKKIESDLQREIGDPRMNRAERDRSSKVFWTGFSENLLFRESREIFSIKAFIPPAIQDPLKWDMDNFRARLEGAYQGFWLRTQTDLVSRSLSDGGSLWSWSQEASLAIGQSDLIGAGLKWDWLSFKSGGISPGDRQGILAVLIHWGAMDPLYNWPLWMITCTYEIPADLSPVYAAYHLNGAADLVLRPGNIFKIEAGAKSHALPRLNTISGYSKESLDHEAVFYAGVGVKVPNPVLWGVRYEGRYLAAFNGNPTTNSAWRFYVEYSF